MTPPENYEPTYADLVLAARASPIVADYQALRLAYAALPDYDPYNRRHDAVALYGRVDRASGRGNWRRAIKLVERLLAGNYLDARAHALAAGIYGQLGEQSQADYHQAFSRGLLDSILRSGDGRSHDTAFSVVSVLEEAVALEALGLQTVRQRRERFGDRTFDVFDVLDPETGQTGVRYFDVALLVKGISEGRARPPAQRARIKKRTVPSKHDTTQDGHSGFRFVTVVALGMVVSGMWFGEPPLAIMGVVLLLIGVAVFWRLGLRAMGRILLSASGGALVGALVDWLARGVAWSAVGAFGGGILGMFVDGISRAAREGNPVTYLAGTLVGMCLLAQGLRFVLVPLILGGVVLIAVTVVLYWRTGFLVGSLFWSALCGALLGTLIGAVSGETGRSILGILVGGASGAILGGVFVIVALRSVVPWPLARIIEAREKRQPKPKSPATPIVFVLAMIPGAYLGARELGPFVARAIGRVSGWAMLGGTVGMAADMLRGLCRRRNQRRGSHKSRPQ